MSIKGSVDVVTTREAFGWAFNSKRADGVVVQAILNQEMIGEAVAKLHRPDLESAGIGTGHCGFAIKFHREIDPMYLPFIAVKPEGGDVELPRAPQTGFVEFFKAVYSAYPLAGRSRTVFGGLWSDRTDALSVLRGKVRIGQIGQKASDRIAEFISCGIMVLPLLDSSGPASLSQHLLEAEEYPSKIADDKQFSDLMGSLLDDRLVILDVEEIKRPTDWSQPSAIVHTPSPAECLECILPLGPEDATVDAIRDSHKLPEFTLEGISRWTSARACAEFVSSENSLVDQYSVAPRNVAIASAGLIRRIVAKEASPALRILCVPTRVLPLGFIRKGNKKEITTKRGVRIWL
jgi:hypothetical protein